MEGSADYNVPQEVFLALEDQLTDEMIVKLTAYAVGKKKRRFWRGIYGAEMPNGIEPSDLVDQAVEKVLDGRRRWNPEKDPDLFEYLMAVIDSDVSNLVMGIANQRVRRESTLSRKTDNDKYQTEGFFDQLTSDGLNPEEELAAKEAEEFLWGLHEYLCEQMRDEPLLQQMLECLFDGVFKPAEMAERLCVKTKDIYNAKKRLDSRLKKFRVGKQGS